MNGWMVKRFHIFICIIAKVIISYRSITDRIFRARLSHNKESKWHVYVHWHAALVHHTHPHCPFHSASKLFILWIRRVSYFHLTPQCGSQVTHVNSNLDRQVRGYVYACVCQIALVWHSGVLTSSCSLWQQPVRPHHPFTFTHRHTHMFSASVFFHL